MKIFDNGTVREMTEEEIEEYNKAPDAEIEDYEQALVELGVKL